MEKEWERPSLGPAAAPQKATRGSLPGGHIWALLGLLQPAPDNAMTHLPQLLWSGAWCAPNPSSLRQVQRSQKALAPSKCEARLGRCTPLMDQRQWAWPELQGLRAFQCPLTRCPRANLGGIGLPSPFSRCRVSWESEPSEEPGSGVSVAWWVGASV